MAGNLFIRLDYEERGALYGLAERELRDVRAQALILIREGLRARGLLATKTADVGDAGGLMHRVVGRGDAGASIAHMAPEGGRDIMRTADT